MLDFCSTDETEMEERWRRGSGGGEFLRQQLRVVVTPEPNPTKPTNLSEPNGIL